MSKQIEAMKLALDALESYKGFIDDAHIIEGQWHWIDGADNAQAALREALAEQPDPDYAWPTIADYEKEVGFEVNDAFRAAWTMARTTNDIFKQMGENT